LTQACAALDAACVNGLQPVTGDATFTRTFPLSELRAVAQEHRVDLGFDPGAERFATFLTLRLCRGLLERLPNVVSAATRFAIPVQGARHNFYLNPNTFPNDVDTTSVASAALFEANIYDRDALVRGAGELHNARYLQENVHATKYLPIPSNAGVAMVYWLDVNELSPFFRRPQFDAAVASNALYAGYLAGELGVATDALDATWRYAEGHLTSGRYANGTLYYPSPDSFLCLFALLCARFPKRLTQTAALALREAIERRNLAANAKPALDPSTSLNLAQRIIAADSLNHASGFEIVPQLSTMKQHLASLQGSDHFWDVGPLYGYGPAPYFIGSRELTTVFALAALTRSWAQAL
jgi:hypothetical protein